MLKYALQAEFSNDLSRNCFATSLVGVVIRAAKRVGKVGESCALSRTERDEDVLYEQVVETVVHCVNVIAVLYALDEGIETAVKSIAEVIS